MIYNLKELQQAHRKGQILNYLFFWGHTPPADGSINQSCFSQWWMSRFAVDGVTYTCAEQFMMAEKARLFHDDDMLARIMEAEHPKEMKAFGRAIQHFDHEVWENNNYAIVMRGSFAKFSQNPELWQYMKATKKEILVEASPSDRVWGIGLAKEDPAAENPLTWRGTNLLGFALTEVRDRLMEKEGE